jgi:exosome complex protein LRP1
MAKAELPEGIQARLDTLEESMTALEAELEPLLSTPWDVLTSKMEPLEKAKLNLMIAYAADSLFFLYLKTQVHASPQRLHQVAHRLLVGRHRR